MQALQILLRRELVAAWRHRWAAVAFAWVICLGGWMLVFTIPNEYEASARLYVDADSVLTPLLQGIAIDSGLAGQLDMLQRTLLSRPNLEKLISKTDLDLGVSTPGDRENLVTALGNQIHIVPQTRNLFTIVYRNRTPKLAFDVVQSILALFVESKTGINRSEMDNARQFIQQQIDSYERQLRDAEKKRADFRGKYVDLLPNENGGVTGLDQARNNVRDLQGTLQDATGERDMIARELASTPPLVSVDTVVAGGGPAINQRLLDAQRVLEELRLKYTDQHPDVIAQKALIEQIRSGKFGADTPSATGGGGEARNRSVPNPIYEQFKVRLLQSQSSIASIQRRLTESVRERDRLEEIARGAPGLQAEFINLDRDYDVLRKNYEELLGRREAMRIATAAESDADKIKLQIIDPPTVPQNPVAPKRMLMVSMVLFAGIGGGLGLALLLVQFDRSFHSIDDLRDLGLPVIGGVSLLTATVGRGRLAAIFTFTVAMILLGAVYAGLLSQVIKPSDFI